LIQTLDRHRRGNRQTVEVRHVHIYPEGQGVVGIVNRAPAEGRIENGRRPYAPEWRTGAVAARRGAAAHERVPVSPAGHLPFMADQGVGCTDVAEALAVLLAGATGTTAWCYTKESTALRELTREVNELLAKTLAAAR
jgi:hypothetical protein